MKYIKKIHYIKIHGKDFVKTLKRGSGGRSPQAASKGAPSKNPCTGLRNKFNSQSPPLGKTENTRSGIWKHMKKCNIVPKPTKKKKKIYQLTDSKVQCTLCEIHCSTLQNVYIMPIHI